MTHRLSLGECLWGKASDQSAEYQQSLPRIENTVSDETADEAADGSTDDAPGNVIDEAVGGEDTVDDLAEVEGLVGVGDGLN